MATSTLPLAVDQDPFQHVTIVNRTVDMLDIAVQPGDSLNGVLNGTGGIWPAQSTTYQSDGIDQWIAVSTGKRITHVYDYSMTGGPYLVPQNPTWLEIPGTAFSVPFAGVWCNIGELTLDVAGVPGNQFWDVDLELYDSTNLVTLGHLDFAGEGNPTVPIFNSWSVMTEGFLPSTTVYLRVSRISVTGDIYVNACEQSITGPF